MINSESGLSLFLLHSWELLVLIVGFGGNFLCFSVLPSSILLLLLKFIDVW